MPRVTNMQLAEYSDRELLLIIRDLERANEQVTSQAIADRIGVAHENPASCVGARMSWLKRYGAVARDEEDGSWGLTQIGRVFAFGDLSKGEQAVVDRLEGGKLVALTSVLARRYQSAPETGGHLIRRQWIYGTNPRRRK